MKNSSPFHGTMTAIVTPFRDGRVDVSALEGLVEEQITAGVQGIVAVGTTGESPTLSDDEHRVVVETVVRATKQRALVIGGAGSNNTAHAIELAKTCQEVGADGTLVVTPYYNRPTQQGLYEHFAAIAKAVPLPMILYNVPSRTSCDLLPDTVMRLAELPQVAAVKEATGGLRRATEILTRCGDQIAVLSGDDFTTMPLYSVGAHGVISVFSNVAPKWMVDMHSAAQKNDWDAARSLHKRMLPLLDLLFCESSPAPIKAALALQGKITDDIRLPLVPMTSANRKKLQVLLTKEGLL